MTEGHGDERERRDGDGGETEKETERQRERHTQRETGWKGSAYIVCLGVGVWIMGEA